MMLKPLYWVMVPPCAVAVDRICDGTNTPRNSTRTAISFAVATKTVNAWVLVISGACLVFAVVLGALGWMFHRRKASAMAAFLWCLPIFPVLLTLSVLGVTYL